MTPGSGVRCGTAPSQPIAPKCGDPAPGTPNLHGDRHRSEPAMSPVIGAGHDILFTPQARDAPVKTQQTSAPDLRAKMSCPAPRTPSLQGERRRQPWSANRTRTPSLHGERHRSEPATSPVIGAGHHILFPPSGARCTSPTGLTNSPDLRTKMSCPAPRTPNLQGDRHREQSTAGRWFGVAAARGRPFNLGRARRCP
jgi:hypothetical protein